MSASYSAYVPCCNNAATVRGAVESLLAQTVAPAEVLVIDDGSTDEPGAALAGRPVRIVRHERNLGRGGVRARAMREAKEELVLCCDATNRLPPEFAARALHWLDDPRLAAAFGSIQDPSPQGLAGRWRARHLFKQDAAPRPVNRRAVLATYGALLRKSAAAQAGGFDARLRHSEDADLGSRLLAAGHEVVFDPELTTICSVHNTLPQVLERYWRWHAGREEAVPVWGQIRHAWYSVRTMAAMDLAHGDLAAAGVSVSLPLFLLGKTWTRRLTGNRQYARTNRAP